MAGVVAAAGVGDADHRALQRIVGVAGALDEGLAKKQGKALVAVVGEAFFQAGGVVAHGVPWGRVRRVVPGLYGVPLNRA